MEITEKTIFLIRLFCVIVLLSLCLASYFYGRSLSCDNCEIKFKQLKRFGISGENDEMEFNVKVLDLYYEFLEGRCLVEWVANNGFVYKEDVDYD